MRKILEAKLYGFSNNNILATYGTSNKIVQDAVANAATNEILPECTIPWIESYRMQRLKILLIIPAIKSDI